MIRSLYTAATGMSAQQLNMDVIANNLANVNTTGFKRSRADFQDLLYQSSRAAGSAAGQGAQVPNGIQVGLGVRTAAIERIQTKGDLRMTGNPLDLNIEGDGFFQVQLTDGTMGYTRDGTFRINGQGQLVNSDGLVVQTPITFQDGITDISVSQDGRIQGKQAGSTTRSELGTIQIARFVNPAGLESVGRNIYLQTDASGDPKTGTPGTDGLGTISSGTLEMSNVKVVEEMVDMITAQRAYEVNSKCIQAADEMLQLANQLRR